MKEKKLGGIVKEGEMLVNSKFSFFHFVSLPH